MGSKTIVEITCDGPVCESKKQSSAAGWHVIEKFGHVNPWGHGFQITRPEDVVYFCSNGCLLRWFEKTTGAKQ